MARFFWATFTLVPTFLSNYTSYKDIWLLLSTFSISKFFTSYLDLNGCLTSLSIVCHQCSKRERFITLLESLRNALEMYITSVIIYTNALNLTYAIHQTTSQLIIGHYTLVRCSYNIWFCMGVAILCFVAKSHGKISFLYPYHSLQCTCKSFIQMCSFINQRLHFQRRFITLLLYLLNRCAIYYLNSWR